VSESYSKQIRQIVSAAESGTIFINSDFSAIASSSTVRRQLNRLVAEGTLRRLMNGLYEKPVYSEFLKEYLAADPDAIAEALARNFRWTIAPCCDTALNLLGLSTQVPSSWSYISDGPYRTYELDGIRLTFKHRTQREILDMSASTILVIEALKALGKDNVTDTVIEDLRKRFSKNEKAAMLKEATEATDWIYRKIGMISKA